MFIRIEQFTEGQAYITTVATNADGDPLSMLIENKDNQIIINRDISFELTDIELENGLGSAIDGACQSLLEAICWALLRL